MPDSRTIYGIRDDCPDNKIDSFYEASFDLNGNVSSESIQLLDPIYMAGTIGTYESPHLSFVQGQAIFSIETTATIHVGPSFMKLAAIPLDEPLSQPLITDIVLTDIQMMDSSPSRNITIYQDDIGLLWLLNSELSPEQITTEPVDYWQFVDDTEIIVRFEGNSLFEILTIE